MCFRIMAFNNSGNTKVEFQNKRKGKDNLQQTTLKFIKIKKDVYYFRSYI